jgi:hypothetical protein
MGVSVLGAHFCEVAVDEEIGRLRVTRWVSVMDIGRVMNAKTACKSGAWRRNHGDWASLDGRIPP